MNKSKVTEVVFPLQAALNLPSLSLGTSNTLETSTKISPSSEQMTTSRHKEVHKNTCLDQEGLVERLNEILESLITEKRQFDQSRALEKEDWQGQINKRNGIIESLLYDNQGLKDQVHKLSEEIQQKKECINGLKKQADRYLSEKDSLKSVVAYLEGKNKEMSFQLYEMKKALMRKEGQKKTSLETIPQQIPKYLVDHLDQESYFEYTGNFNNDLSRQIKRVESMPAFELVSDMLQGEVPETLVKSGLRSYQEKGKEKEDVSKNNSSRQATNCSKSSKPGILRKRASISKNQLGKAHLEIRKKGERDKKQIKTDVSNKKELREQGQLKKEKRGKK